MNKTIWWFAISLREKASFSTIKHYSGACHLSEFTCLLTSVPHPVPGTLVPAASHTSQAHSLPWVCESSHPPFCSHSVTFSKRLLWPVHIEQYFFKSCLTCSTFFYIILKTSKFLSSILFLSWSCSIRMQLNVNSMTQYESMFALNRSQNGPYISTISGILH